ncbi:transglycosylase domain-containing protein [Litorimonas sp. RW-G-Af-16]|uniref:transglycosylase domain-containing protein n=1 Tax=Litorimonas sp. RW-G-Af-16 TaxID=3241168 RepID=UPI00390C45A3
MELPRLNFSLPPRVKALGKATFITGALGGYLCGMGVLGLFALAAKDLPDPKKLWERSRPVSVQIVDRNGVDVVVRGAAKEQPVDLDTLPFHIPMTILATEDRRYYNHVGVDPQGLARAMVSNVRAGRYVQGGSTLTQQLSKNIFLSPDKTLRRKAQEMMLSVWLERDFTKRELLEMYLSRVYFGSGAWGLEAASQTYFDKPAAEMTLAESAMMAGLLKAPSAGNPAQHPERAAKRTATVLNSMQRQGLLAEGVLEMALNEDITIHRPQSDHTGQYFVDWIWNDLEAAIGVPTQDIIVQTTLDMRAQSAAQSAMLAHLDTERGASEGAVVSLDGTGGVIAMVGGTSYTKSQFNRAAQAERQPGSAFKPFVYLAALRAGISPWDTRIDAPITLAADTRAGEDWTPQNFSETFSGPITLQDALAKSINTVAVTLGEEVGREAVIAAAGDFGLTGLTPYRSLALGAQLTTPLQMTEAYLPFANWGQKRPAYGIISISTADGTPLYDHVRAEPKPVLTPVELADMNLMLTRVVEQGTGRRAQIAGRHIGGKTGTTNDFRDAWFIGYAPDVVTSVWVGADDNTPMKRVTGGTIPAQIFHDYMDVQLSEQPATRLPVSQEPDWVRRNAQLNALLDQLEGKLP